MGALVIPARVIEFLSEDEERLQLWSGLSASFLIEAGNRVGFLWLDNPNEGAAGIYLVRLVSYLLILAAHREQE